MPLTITQVRRTVTGNLRYLTVDLDFDSSYPTNGEPLVPADVGMTVFDLVLIEPKVATIGATASCFIFDYNRTNSAVRAWEQGFRTGSTAVADATTGALAENTAAAETTFRAMGTAVDTNISLGGLREVPPTTNLSTLTGVRAVIWGY